MTYSEAWRYEAKVQLSFLFHLFPVNVPVLFFIQKYGNVWLFCIEWFDVETVNIALGTMCSDCNFSGCVDYIRSSWNCFRKLDRADVPNMGRCLKF